ncbi:hypothetical protein [Sphingobacterium mizutaii]|uniref:hypothetical protein n=1 Tax=Sphingobacterium mizutaii TaxID=1010 RepID=UPI001624F688|nr:hypothetical protein [Sphingobacterium mizutaii]
MAGTNNKTATPKNTNYVKTLIWISVPVFLLMISLLVFLWCSLDKNINDIREQNKKNYESIASLEKMSLIEIELTPLNKKQVIIEPKEIEKINSHIKILTEAIQNEKSRTETLIDKDLSRLGTYMAVGIGFMTLLGVFVPILINVLSVQDLRDKQKYIEDKTDKALDSSNKLDEFSKKVDSIESKTLNVSLDLCNLNLQNSIARFFNVGPLVLSRAISRNNFDKFVTLLEDIKIAFENCKNNENHIITENNLFSKTVDDFIDFIDSEKFRFQSIFLKAEVEEFDNLIKHLGVLKDSNNDNESENYKTLDGQIDVIINIFKGKHVKNQPTA